MKVEMEFEDDGYASVECRGTIHVLRVFTTSSDSRDSLFPLMIEIDGVSQATGLLDQEDINTLHEFLGQFVKPVD